MPMNTETKDVFLAIRLQDEKNKEFIDSALKAGRIDEERQGDADAGQ